MKFLNPPMADIGLLTCRTIRSRSMRCYRRISAPPKLLYLGISWLSWGIMWTQFTNKNDDVYVMAILWELWL
jgi:hypothetical protein